MESSVRRPRRLVLSGGATGGAYWMAGALEALSGAGLDPASAVSLDVAADVYGARVAQGHVA
jgi:hypothetical protein